MQGHCYAVQSNHWENIPKLTCNELLKKSEIDLTGSNIFSFLMTKKKENFNHAFSVIKKKQKQKIAAIRIQYAKTPAWSFTISWL